MDRRYGGDPLAPPRPPKLLPRVHRPRAPEPSIMSAPLQPTHTQNNVIITTQPLQQSNSNNHHQQQQQQQQHHHQQQQQQHHQQQRQLHQQHFHHNNSSNHHQQQLQQQQQQQLIPAPSTAPLISLHSSTSFSRRRPPPSIITISSLSSNIHSFETTPISPVTLAAPRPENERLANEYVDTPFRPPHLVSRIHHHGQSGTISSLSSETTTTTTTTTIPPTPASSAVTPNTIGTPKSQFVPPSSLQSHTTSTTIPPSTTAISSSTIRTAIRPTALPVTAITKQPISFTKDLSTATLHEDIDIHPSNGDSLNSITCPQCKRCRCEECQRPRQLPSRWVCDKTCLCSAETIIDYTSCFCCVKALFYHCSTDHEMEQDGDSISCADDPCSCAPHKRTQRWAWLGALSMVLPCLWCYWPMRGCVALCAKCYARHSRHGCRCPQSKLSHHSSSGGGGIGGDRGSGGGIGSGGGSGGGGGGVGGSLVSGVGSGIGRTLSRTCDLTPEKRLLDSSPEY